MHRDSLMRLREALPTSPGANHRFRAKRNELPAPHTGSHLPDRSGRDSVTPDLADPSYPPKDHPTLDANCRGPLVDGAHTTTGTVRTCFALASRSGITQCSSRTWKSSVPHPTNSACRPSGTPDEVVTDPSRLLARNNFRIARHPRTIEVATNYSGKCKRRSSSTQRGSGCNVNNPGSDFRAAMSESWSW